jgi:DNA-binding MarR family transcriptional regulator
MQLGDEIRQRRFRDDYHKLAVNILYTHGRLVSVMSDMLRPYDLTLAQFNILRILRGSQPEAATISYLQSRMLDKMSDTSRLVQRLYMKGFVERVAEQQDRRKVGIVITRAGLDTLERIGDFDLLLSAMASTVTPEQADVANKVLDSVREALHPVDL